jgi:NitT/TauT family transport system substrate-binding protein
MKSQFKILLIFFTSASLWGNGGGEVIVEEQPLVVSVSVPSGAPTMAMAQLVSQGLPDYPGYLTEYEILRTPDLLGARLISGEADLAIVPTNLAARLYNQGQDVKIVAGVVWGIFYVVGTGEYSSWEDLKGETLSIFGRGLTPDLVFRFLAEKNGLEILQDLSLVYLGGATEVAPAFLAGKSSLALVPEPMLSMILKRKPEAKVVLDLQAEWAKLSDSGRSYPQASLIVQGSFAQEHPEYLAAFIKAFRESTLWLEANPGEAGLAGSQLMEGSNPEILGLAVPGMRVEYVPAQEAKGAIASYLSVLLEANDQSLSGDLPDDGFYW